MLKNSYNSKELLEEDQDLNINKDNKKIFMNLYPVMIDDSSPKHYNNHSKYTNVVNEKRKNKKLNTNPKKEKDDLLNVDGTYIINDIFFESIVKDNCPLNKKKVQLTIGKFMKKSDLMEKIRKEFQADNNETPENLCNIIASNMSFVEYKKNKAIYKVGDNADKLFFVIKGKVNIYKPIKVKVKMSFKDYLLYCLLLIRYKEEFLLNKILIKYCKTIPIMFIEEIKKTFNILFKMKLLEKIQHEVITNNNELKLYFKENNVNLDDFYLNIRELENLLSEKSSKKGFINLRDENRNLSGNQDWVNYILSKCSISYSESSYFEKFEKFIEKKEKMDLDCYIFEYYDSAYTGKYFGDLSIEKDGGFIKKKREYSIFAEEDTILGTIKNEEFIYTVAPKLKIERMKNINFINNIYFFKPINNYNFSKNYFQYFIRHEMTRDNYLFKINSYPQSLHIIQEGIVSLNVQCTLIQLNEIIQKLYIKLITNKYYSEVINKKIISKQAINTIKNYANDYALKNLKLHNQKFIEEINKIGNFQISNVSKDEIIGLEEIFFEIPFFVNGIIISEKCIFYELPLDNLEYIIKLEANVEEIYFKASVNKLLSLIERLQTLKQHIIDYTKKKYDNIFDINKNKNNNQEIIMKNDNKNEDNNINDENNTKLRKDSKENTNIKSENNSSINDEKNIKDSNKTNSEFIVYNGCRYKSSKRGFSSIKKERINYKLLENIKNIGKEEEGEKKKGKDINDNNNEYIVLQSRKSLKYAKSAKKLSVKKHKNLCIKPIAQNERAGSVDFYKLKAHNKNKNENIIKDAIFIIDKYYTLDSIKKSIERNKNKIQKIKSLYENRKLKNKTINDKEYSEIDYKNKIEEKIENNINIKNNFKKINQEAELDKNLYKNINLKLNIKKNFEKFKTINDNRNIIYNTNSEKHSNRKNILKKRIINLHLSDDYDKNRLFISNNYLFSKPPSLLPKLNMELNNKLNLHLPLNSINSNKNCSSSRAIMDKIIEKNKKEIIPKIVKNFYENKKIRGYISFIANKKSNTLFLRKYHKKYDKNILLTEDNEKILPKIYKNLPLNKSLSPNN